MDRRLHRDDGQPELRSVEVGLQSYIRGLLAPNENRFFDLLEQQATIAREAAAMLATFGNGVGATELSERLQEIEHRGDALVHEIEESLARTYVTPIDREDIHSLCGALDEVVDLTNRTARACVLMGVALPTEAMIGLMGVLVRATEKLAETVPLLRRRDYQAIFAAKQQIRGLEKEADRLHRQAIKTMYGTEWTDLRAILREREVLDDVEDAIDHCERILDTLANLAIKHG